MSPEKDIHVNVHLLPPLSNTAGKERVKLTLKTPPTIQRVIEALLERFDSPEFRLHLYDTEGRLVPAWRAFVNGRPSANLGRREDLATPVADGDEITFLLALAGG